MISFFNSSYRKSTQLKKKESEMEEQLIEMNAGLKQRRDQFEREREAFELVKREMDVLIIANQENVKEYVSLLDVSYNVYHLIGHHFLIIKTSLLQK